MEYFVLGSDDYYGKSSTDKCSNPTMNNVIGKFIPVKGGKVDFSRREFEVVTKEEINFSQGVQFKGVDRFGDIYRVSSKGWKYLNSNSYISSNMGVKSISWPDNAVARFHPRVDNKHGKAFFAESILCGDNGCYDVIAITRSDYGQLIHINALDWAVEVRPDSKNYL